MKFAHFALRCATLISENKRENEIFLNFRDGHLVADSEGFHKLRPSAYTTDRELEVAVNDAWAAFEKSNKTHMIPLERLIPLLNNGEESNYTGLIQFTKDELKMQLENFTVENMGALIGMALMQVWGSKVLHLDQDLISQIRNGDAQTLTILRQPGLDILQNGHETLRCLMAVKACHPADFHAHYAKGIPVRYLELGKDIITDDAEINEEQLQTA